MITFQCCCEKKKKFSYYLTLKSIIVLFLLFNKNIALLYVNTRCAVFDYKTETEQSAFPTENSINMLLRYSEEWPLI